LLQFGKKGKNKKKYKEGRKKIERRKPNIADEWVTGLLFTGEKSG
jgi:hypothetical protein